jgi:DNA-binding ferritin-like protein
MRRKPRYNRRWNAARAGGDGLEQLKDLLAAMRASYLMYRTAHWQARGDAYYGDHLMLQRIYEETEKHADQVGERIVGYYGASAVDMADQTERVAQWSERFSREGDPVKASLEAAKAVRDLLTRTYNVLERSKQLTLGLDDLLMSISNDKDTHVYLLQQALDGRKVTADRAQNPRILRWKLTR